MLGVARVASPSTDIILILVAIFLCGGTFFNAPTKDSINKRSSSRSLVSNLSLFPLDLLKKCRLNQLAFTFYLLYYHWYKFK